MDKSRYDNLSANGGSARPNNVQPNLNVNSAPNPSTVSSPSQMPKFGATLNSNSTSASSAPSSPNPASSSSVLSRTQTQPQPQNPAARNDVAFKSDRIGQWSAKQDNPFAEQNRKAAEKKAAQEAARKKALPYIKLGGIIGGCIVLIVIIAVVVVNITKPKLIVELTPEESATIQEGAQSIFDKYTQHINLEDVGNTTEKEKEDIQKALEEVGKYYEQQADRTQDEGVRIQLIMEEMMFYLWNNQPEAALKTSEKISIDNITIKERTEYYSLIGDIYALSGDEDQAQYYYKLMREAVGGTYVEG